MSAFFTWSLLAAYLFLLYQMQPKGNFVLHWSEPLTTWMNVYSMFCTICKFTQFRNCAVQIRKCEIANQLRNFAATFAHSWNCAGTHHQPVFWLEGKAHPLGRGENSLWAEMDTFCPELEWWATVSILSGRAILCLLLFEIVLLVSIGIVCFAECFKTLSQKIDACAFFTCSLICLYRNFEIGLLNFEIALYDLKLDSHFNIGE